MCEYSKEMSCCLRGGGGGGGEGSEVKAIYYSWEAIVLIITPILKSLVILAI